MELKNEAQKLVGRVHKQYTKNDFNQSLNRLNLKN